MLLLAWLSHNRAWESPRHLSVVRLLVCGLGHATALTAIWAVIHYRVAATLPLTRWAIGVCEHGEGYESLPLEGKVSSGCETDEV